MKRTVNCASFHWQSQLYNWYANLFSIASDIAITVQEESEDESDSETATYMHIYHALCRFQITIHVFLIQNIHCLTPWMMEMNSSTCLTVNAGYSQHTWRVWYTKGQMHTKEHLHSLCNPDVITCIHIQVLIDLSQYRNYHALSACTHSPSTPQHTLAGTTPEVLTIGTFHSAKR